MSYVKESCKEHLQMAFDLLLETLFTIFALFTFFSIDKVIHYLGYESEAFTSLLHHYIHPIILGSFATIFIINMFMKYLPGTSDSKFEIIYESEKATPVPMAEEEDSQ